MKKETLYAFELSPNKLRRENQALFGSIAEEFKNKGEYNQKMRYSEYTKTRISITQLNSSQTNETYRKGSIATQ